MEMQSGNESVIPSIYAADPRVSPIIPLFLGRLEEILACFSDSLSRQDWKALSTTSHQLKGSSGGYGYPLLMDAAAKIEGEAKKAEPNPEMLKGFISECEKLCKRLC